MPQAKIEVLTNAQNMRNEVYVNNVLIYQTKNTPDEEKANIRALLYALDEDNPANKMIVQ